MEDLFEKDIFFISLDEEPPTDLISDIKKLSIVLISSNLGIKIL